MKQLELITEPYPAAHFKALYRNLGTWMSQNLKLFENNKVELKRCKKYLTSERWSENRVETEMADVIAYVSNYEGEVYKNRPNYLIKPQVTIGGNIVNTLDTLCKNARYMNFETDNDKIEEKLLCSCIPLFKSKDCYSGYLLLKAKNSKLMDKSKFSFYIRNEGVYVETKPADAILTHFTVADTEYQMLKGMLSTFSSNNKSLGSELLEFRGFNKLCFGKFTEWKFVYERFSACLAFLRIESTAQTDDEKKTEEEEKKTLIVLEKEGRRRFK